MGGSSEDQDPHESTMILLSCIHIRIQIKHNEIALLIKSYDPDPNLHPDLGKLRLKLKE